MKGVIKVKTICPATIGCVDLRSDAAAIGFGRFAIGCGAQGGDAELRDLRRQARRWLRSPAWLFVALLGNRESCYPDAVLCIFSVLVEILIGGHLGGHEGFVRFFGGISAEIISSAGLLE